MAKNWMKIKALPEENEIVLITVRNEDGELETDVATYSQFEDGEGRWIGFNSKLFHEEDIVAWSSLPKPYKE